MKASLRVQQRKKAAGSFRLRQCTEHRLLARRERPCGEAGEIREGPAQLHVDADGTIPARGDHREVPRVGQVEARGRRVTPTKRGLAVGPVREGYVDAASRPRYPPSIARSAPRATAKASCRRGRT